MDWCRATIVLSGVLLGALSGGVAYATPSFPAVVEDALHLRDGIPVDAPTGCKLCHERELGGDPLTSFGLLLKTKYRVHAYDEASLRTALQGAEFDPNDGILIADLQAGRDPNANPASVRTEAPGYGCAVGKAASLVRGSKGVPSLACFVAFWGIVLRRRRGRLPPFPFRYVAQGHLSSKFHIG